MALGGNDCLGISTNKGSVYPSRLKLVTGTSSTTGTVTWAAATVSITNGQIEWIRDAVWGDRVVAKQAGLYCISVAGRVDSTSNNMALTRNLPQVLWGTAPTTLIDTTTTNNQYVLAFMSNPTASACIPMTMTVWAEEGDYFQLSLNAGMSSSNPGGLALYIEKLGG